jgi:hypothetical protein
MKAETILYLLLGLLINVSSLVVFGILNYLNPSTYYGNDGFNSGLITLCIMLPVWWVFLFYYRSKKNNSAMRGVGINMIINVLFYLILTFTE